jgi:hypothetical protein
VMDSAVLHVETPAAEPSCLRDDHAAGFRLGKLHRSGDRVSSVLHVDERVLRYAHHAGMPVSSAVRVGEQSAVVWKLL